MDTQIRRLLAAGAVAGFLTIGGISLASAQEDPTSTTQDTVANQETTTTVDDSTADDSTTDDSTADDSTANDDCPHDGTDTTADAG